MKYISKLIFSLFCMWSCISLYAQVPDKAENISPLLIGEELPNATLQDARGNQVQLKELFLSKPTVLIFYRGGWCPYCNKQLFGLATIEKNMNDLGYQIIAISPENYRNLKDTESKDSINYMLLSDPNAKLIQQVGIGFSTPTMIKGYIATKGQKGETSDIMPVPTVMVLDKNGKILFEYINPNYKERISSELLISVLKTLKQ